MIGPIASLFWVDKQLESEVYLDGEYFSFVLPFFIFKCKKS